MTTEWCAAFVNFVLELNDVPTLHDINHAHPLVARSFLHWGNEIPPEDIQRGDLVVFPRENSEWKGHVGFFFDKVEDGRWIILGGNQNNKVTYDLYQPSQALGIRRHTLRKPIE